MGDLVPVGRTLMLLGVLLVVVGAVLTFAPQVPLLGKLPGDIRIERPGLRFYFPVTTCVVLSLGLSLLLSLIAKIR
ncbi:MAG: DUF2905 domain-containing protein [Myxococcota bacterium]|nr:DUF2905 domain-containing protein [Myxococcota bacterium]